jgi:hypothetical protein
LEKGIKFLSLRGKGKHHSLSSPTKNQNTFFFFFFFRGFGQEIFIIKKKGRGRRTQDEGFGPFIYLFIYYDSFFSFFFNVMPLSLLFSSPVDYTLTRTDTQGKQV